MSSKLVARILNKSECTSISVFPIYQKLNHHLRHKFLFKVLFQNTLYIRDLPLLRKVAKNVTIYFNLSEPPNMFISFRYIKWSAYPLKLAPTICLTKIQYLDRHLWLLQAFKQLALEIGYVYVSRVVHTYFCEYHAGYCFCVAHFIVTILFIANQIARCFSSSLAHLCTLLLHTGRRSVSITIRIHVNAIAATEGTRIKRGAKAIGVRWRTKNLRKGKRRWEKRSC